LNFAAEDTKRAGMQTTTSMQTTAVHARFEGSEAFVLLMADGVAVRKPKRRGASAAMRDSADLLHVSQHPHLVCISSIEDGVA
jgi:hypothetical protein